MFTRFCERKKTEPRALAPQENVFMSFWAARIRVHEKMCYEVSVACPRNEEDPSFLAVIQEMDSAGCVLHEISKWRNR